MRIALISHHVAPIAPPFVGGVESHTWYLARWLANRGHDVTLFGLSGSSVPGVRVEQIDVTSSGTSPAARRDVSSQPEPFLAAHHAYLQLMLDLTRSTRFDAIHVNTLHYLPVAMAASLPVRPLLTLHCPPTPWLESALTLANQRGPLPLDVVAVSSSLSRGWAHAIPAPAVIPNGIDLRTWRPGPGGSDPAWAGRIVPEKAPHLAIDAARLAGQRLKLAGPIVDQTYFDDYVAPRLGTDAEYVGHLGHRELAALLGSASVAVQSAVWEEPFGLSAAEAIACGTPVAAFARGGLTDVVGPDAGRLAAPDDVRSLGEAMVAAAKLDRGAVRRHAEVHLGVDAMGLAYERALERCADSAHAPFVARDTRTVVTRRSGDRPRPRTAAGGGPTVRSLDRARAALAARSAGSRDLSGVLSGEVALER